MVVKRYLVEEFIGKYKKLQRKLVSCGINYTDGTRDTIVSKPCSMIISYINEIQKEKNIAFIASI